MSLAVTPERGGRLCQRMLQLLTVPELQFGPPRFGTERESVFFVSISDMALGIPTAYAPR